MAKTMNTRSGTGELSTIIGPDANLEGRLSVKNSMRVDGRIKGELTSNEVITVGSNGAVDGDVTAKDIIVGGKITGKLNASGKVVLESKSILNGDLKTGRLVVEEGAVFNGTSDMGGEPRSTIHAPRKINLTGE